VIPAQDAVIDGLVTNLVVNGLEVTSYIEAELDRRPSTIGCALPHLRSSFA
jgi:hypothetical protein